MPFEIVSNTPFFKNDFLQNTQNLSESHNWAIFVFSQTNVRTKSQSTWQNNDYTNVIKSIKMIWNSKHRSERKQKTQEDETLVFQKNRYKMQTYINPFEENNHHMWVIHKIQFWSYFNRKLFAPSSVLTTLLWGPSILISKNDTWNAKMTKTKKIKFNAHVHEILPIGFRREMLHNSIY